MIYPPPSHPQYELARRQMKEGGTVVAFDIPGDKEACFRFLDALRLVDISNNLGDSKSLITHRRRRRLALKPEERAALGIGDGSCGFGRARSRSRLLRDSIGRWRRLTKLICEISLIDI